MSFIKWWKSKTFWLIALLVVVAMVSCFLSAYYIPHPYGLICVFVILIPIGLGIRKLAFDAIKNYFKQ